MQACFGIFILHVADKIFKFLAFIKFHAFKPNDTKKRNFINFDIKR